jgi:inorganic triphosphatase YgiF
MQGLDHQEVEWQFEAADLDLVENWLEEHPSASGLPLVPEATKELIDTYYDTEDWRFYRAGYALRVRRDGESFEATMKSLTPAEGALRRRREISEPLKGNIKTPKGARGPVGERVRRLAGTRDLRLLFEVRTRRRIFALHLEGSDRVVDDASGDIRRREKEAVVGEVALDEAEISGDEKAPTRLSRIEVEVASDAGLRDGVEDFVDGLRDALRLRPTKLSKFELGLSVAGLNPTGTSDFGSKERVEHSNEKGGR